MEKQLWSNTEIQKIFKLDKEDKNSQVLFDAMMNDEIPKSQLIKRGNLHVHRWRLDQLPEIGNKFGFLQKPKQQEVICVYTAKGGVLKTTLSYCLARILALNGIKTLIVGLDIQCSITELTLPEMQVDSLDEVSTSMPGLYHFLYEKVPLNEIIKKTSLGTLDIIPETTDLNVLERALRLEKRREYVLQDKLIPHLGAYDVVIFDNSPSWNQLTENALIVSKTVISPAGCDLGTYKTLQTNLGTLREFQEAMRLEWNNFIIVPTLLEKTKLSQQIYQVYQDQYGDTVIPSPIRRAVKGQESLVLKQSPIEYDPSSGLAQDYFGATEKIWNMILGIPETTDKSVPMDQTYISNMEVENGPRI